LLRARDQIEAVHKGETLDIGVQDNMRMLLSAGFKEELKIVSCKGLLAFSCTQVMVNLCGSGAAQFLPA